MSVIPNTYPAYGTSPYTTAVPSNQQVVIPQITFPQVQMPQMQNPMVQGPQLNKVHGMDGAKQFITVSNAMYALFDDDDDVFYIKVTDKNNYPVTLKRYRFFEEEEPVAAVSEAVTKEQYQSLSDEVQSLKEELRSLKEGSLNAKQSVRSKASKSGGTAIDADIVPADE